MNGGTFTRLRDASFLVSLLLFVVFLFSASADAVINRQINFQGKLTNTDGTNVTDGNYSIAFNMYTVASGGSSVWTETHATVSVTDGIFRVDLGNITSLPGSVDFNNSSLYLGITVGADPEMTPRVRFTAAPYAFNSDELDGIDSSGFVQVAPASVQTDASTNALIFLNKTSSGNLLQLQQSAADEFVVDNSGIVTTASINSGSIVNGTVANGDLVNSSVTVIAGSGLITGGSVSLGGSVTVDIGAGDGVVVNMNDVALDVLTTGTTATTSANSGLEVSSDGLRLLGGCGDGDVLAWNDTTDVWQCSTNNAIYTAIKAANYTNNSQSLTNVTDISFPIAANEEWYFEFDLQVDADADDDARFQINCPTGATGVWGVVSAEQTVTRGNESCDNLTGNVAQNNNPEVLTIAGTISNGSNAGTVQLQMRENSAVDAANGITVFAGSSVHAMRIPIGGFVSSSPFTFDITDGSNTETINNGDNLTYVDGTGLDILVSGTDTVTYSVEDDSLSFAQFSDSLTLDAVTTISAGANNFVVNLDGAGDFIVQDNGTAFFSLLDSGAVLLDGNTAGTVELRFGEDSDNGTNYVGLQAPASIVTNLVWVLPNGDGADEDVLATDGFGNLKWQQGLRTDCLDNEVLRWDDTGGSWLCDNPVYEKIVIWAEENAAASSSTSAGNQWSFGNGAVGAIGIPLAESWEIYAVSFDAETFGTSVSIDVVNRNGGAVLHSFTANSDNYFATLGSPVSVSAGDTIGFDTTATVGTSTDVRAAVWLRRLP